MRVSAKKANSTTTDVVLEIRMTEEEAKARLGCLQGQRITAQSAVPPLDMATAAVLKEHLKTRFRVSRVVGP